jgi:hypothetical protein
MTCNTSNLCNKLWLFCFFLFYLFIYTFQVDHNIYTILSIVLSIAFIIDRSQIFCASYSDCACMGTLSYLTLLRIFNKENLLKINNNINIYFHYMSPIDISKHHMFVFYIVWHVIHLTYATSCDFFVFFCFIYLYIHFNGKKYIRMLRLLGW